MLRQGKLPGVAGARVETRRLSVELGQHCSHAGAHFHNERDPDGWGWEQCRRPPGASWRPLKLRGSKTETWIFYGACKWGGQRDNGSLGWICDRSWWILGSVRVSWLSVVGASPGWLRPSPGPFGCHRHWGCTQRTAPWSSVTHTSKASVRGGVSWVVPRPAWRGGDVWPGSGIKSGCHRCTLWQICGETTRTPRS